MSWLCTLAPLTRRVVLPLIGAGSVIGAVCLQYAPRDVLDVRSASTGQLVGILALLFLPALTIGVVLVDRKMRPRTRPARPVPVLLTPPNLRPPLSMVEAKPVVLEWEIGGDTRVGPASISAQRAA